MTSRTHTTPTAKARMAAKVALSDFNKDDSSIGKAVSFRLKNLGGSSKVQAFAVHFLDRLGQSIGNQYLGNFVS